MPGNSKFSNLDLYFEFFKSIFYGIPSLVCKNWEFYYKDNVAVFQYVFHADFQLFTLSQCSSVYGNCIFIICK